MVISAEKCNGFVIAAAVGRLEKTIAIPIAVMIVHISLLEGYHKFPPVTMDSSANPK